MSEMPANGDPGFRITLGVVYEAVQAQGKAISALDTSVKLMDQRMNNVLQENSALRSRVSKLESRMNGVLVGVGGGIATAFIVYFRGLFP